MLNQRDLFGSRFKKASESGCLPKQVAGYSVQTRSQVTKGRTYLYGTFNYGHDVLAGSQPARLTFFLDAFASRDGCAIYYGDRNPSGRFERLE